MASLKADLDDYLKGRQSQNFGGNLVGLAKSFTLPTLKFGSSQSAFDEESGSLDSASLVSDKQVLNWAFVAQSAVRLCSGAMTLSIMTVSITPFSMITVSITSVIITI